MNKMKCLIIEDEIPAAEDLKHIVSVHPFFEVAEIAHDAVAGYSLVIQSLPDLIFLDINIPEQNGIELAKKIRNSGFNTSIIFVTAYEQYALEAFEVEAVDYILKPFEEKRIYSTMNRLYEKWKNTNSKNLDSFAGMKGILSHLEQTSKPVKKIPCDINGKTVLINIEDICFCYVTSEKTFVKTREKTLLTSFTLCELEKKTGFFRSHKSYIVNLNYLKELYPWFNGTYELVIDDLEKSKIPLSRNYVKSLKNVLGFK